MNSAPRFLSALLGVIASVATACSPPMMNPDASDASADARADDGPPRNDLLNLNCTSAAGDENAADCNQRLMNMESGASFFIGGFAACSVDPNSENCRPLCDLTTINPTNCSFDAPATGCRIRHSEGTTVVVTAGGHRWTASVGDGNICSPTAMGTREWQRVNFDDLRTAARCAASMPTGGFGPERYGSCPTPMTACGNPASTPADSCSELMFMAGMRSYTANLCTHACTADAECGPRGTCFNSTCWGKCGGLCGITCPDHFSCTMPMGATQTLCFPDAPQ